MPEHQPPSGQRFLLHGRDVVEDFRTGLLWPRSANILGYPLDWAAALDAVAGLNRERFLGFGDWRLPNRRELRSLIDHAEKQPALPSGHPFQNVFSGWYWTSTSKAGLAAYAWNVHFEGGRMFYSRKDDFRLLWPVRGQSHVLAQTGQTGCYDASGLATRCLATGQDGELRAGLPWPAPRFEPTARGLVDRLTGLCWMHPAELPERPLSWPEALAFASAPGWRLPGIDALESLVDAQYADPALPRELSEPLPRALLAEGFWSGTTSGFDAAWAFVLYAQKGAVGVGFKTNRDFWVWPVRSGE